MPNATVHLDVAAMRRAYLAILEALKLDFHILVLIGGAKKREDVLDPSFLTRDVNNKIEALCRKAGFKLIPTTTFVAYVTPDY